MFVTWTTNGLSHNNESLKEDDGNRNEEKMEDYSMKEEKTSAQITNFLA